MYSILESGKPTLVKVFSESCGPCKMMAPIIKELEKEFTDVVFAEINGPENREVLKQFNIVKVPTFVFINKGEVRTMVAGAQSKARLATLIRDHLV